MFGYCPKCGCANIEWGTIAENKTDKKYAVYYPVTCKKCGFKGIECFNLHFVDYKDDKNKTIEPVKT